MGLFVTMDHRVGSVLVVLLGLSFISLASSACVRATSAAQRTATCNFDVSEFNQTACNTTLRQNFRLLTVSNDAVLVGSAECVYVLDTNLAIIDSYSLPLSDSDRTTCEFNVGNNNLDAEAFCSNYMTVGLETSSSSNSNTSYLCGTYGLEAKCWTCEVNETGIHNCDSGVTNSILPSSPGQNFTAFEEDGLFFFGGVESFSSEDPVFAKIDENGEISSYPDERWMTTPHDFVGKPIAHREFLYFFYREQAIENDISPTIYSRVARICKDSLGGVTNPLSGKFITFLKTRLVCSAGSDYPVFYNEIQDVQKSAELDFVYGLFTTPNGAMSTSAICRYNLNELTDLFNITDRRGQPPNEVWQKITNAEIGDTIALRTCVGNYGASVYDDLIAYPLLNSNAQTSDDDVLAVFPDIRGQRLAVLHDTNDGLTVYIGTNRPEIYRADIKWDGNVSITEKTTIACNIAPQTNNGIWPYGVTSLVIKNGNVYGTIENCAFTFPAEVDESESPKIRSRSDEKQTYVYAEHLTTGVSIFKLFEAQEGTDMNATFSGDLESVACTQKRFVVSDLSCKEFLHVHCNVTQGLTETITGTITVESLSNTTQPLEIGVTVTVDSSERCSCCHSDGQNDVTVENCCDEIGAYDNSMAEYRYEHQEWLKSSVKCGTDNKPLDTCPSASTCTYP